MESFRALLRQRDVRFHTEGGTKLVFRGDSCTVTRGTGELVLPPSEYLAVSRILEQGHELMHMPENEKSRSR